MKTGVYPFIYPLQILHKRKAGRFAWLFVFILPLAGNRNNLIEERSGEADNRNEWKHWQSDIAAGKTDSLYMIAMPDGKKRYLLDSSRIKKQTLAVCESLLKV